MARAVSDKDVKALELFRSGVPLQVIRDQLGYKSVTTVSAAVDRARAAQGAPVEPASVREVELDRLNRLQAAVWPKALKGDPKFVEQAVRLSEARVKLSGVPAQSTVQEELEKTLGVLELSEVDAAVVATARRIAQSIDAAAGTGDRTLEMKALYLVPHLMNVLRELGATPAVRGELKAAAGAAVTVKAVDEFEAFKRRKAQGV